MLLLFCFVLFYVGRVDWIQGLTYGGQVLYHLQPSSPFSLHLAMSIEKWKWLSCDLIVRLILVYGVPIWLSPQSTLWCKRLLLFVIEKGSYSLLASTMLSFQGSIGWRLYGESILVKRNRRPFMWNAVSHKSQASILENLKSKCSDRIERWSLCLWRHDTRVIYRAGTNSPADCVSRHPSCETKPTRHEEMVRKPLSEGQTTSSRRLDSVWDSWPM